jgi:hypothetical protein
MGADHRDTRRIDPWRLDAGIPAAHGPDSLPPYLNFQG